MQTPEAINQIHDEVMPTIQDIPAGHPSKLAQVWIIAKPILQTLSVLFFLPKKWRDTISILIQEVDILTGGE